MMNLKNQIDDFIHYAAKAVASFVTIILVMVVARITNAIGIDIPFDPNTVSEWLTGVFVAAANSAVVYKTTNEYWVKV